MPLDATPMKFLVTVMPGFTKLSLFFILNRKASRHNHLFFIGSTDWCLLLHFPPVRLGDDIKTMLFFNLFMFWKFSFARIGIQLMVSMRCMCIEPRILYTLFFYYSLFALVWCNMLRFNKTSMRSLTLILTSYLVLSLVLYQNLYFLVHVLFCWTAFCMSWKSPIILIRLSCEDGSPLLPYPSAVCFDVNENTSAVVATWRYILW